MPGSIVIPRSQSTLEDPAQSQYPIMFYVGAVRRRAVWIMCVTLGLTALAAVVSATFPPINVGVATVAIDRQSAPTTIGEDRPLSTGDDQFMATQQSLLQADVILRPVVERYDLLDRENQFRRSIFWKYAP